MGLRENRLVLKWALFFFNILFWVLGIAVFGVGIYVKTDHSDYAIIMDEHSNGYSGTLIAVGAIVMVVGLVGCIGTLKENRTLLVVYASLVSLIFILECVAGGLGYQFRDKLRDEVIKGMNTTIAKYDPAVNNRIRNAWKSVQAENECCGVQQDEDWLSNETLWYDFLVMHQRLDKKELPYSCCLPSNVPCSIYAENHYNETCFGVVHSAVRYHWKELAGTAIGIAFAQLIGIVLSAILAHSIKKYGRYNQFD
ncbi:CD151 antigen-like [Sycon ciliatum]|uniref:CD151 antigen-like n=1 Tax=Sycon ciliatum TaxID=27933 RepID=UPI0020AE9B78|eukprot:scpid74709/ scgid16754/ Tetraspanin-33